MTAVIRKRMSCECMHYDADKHMAIEAPCACEQAPKSLTSLDDGLRMLEVWGPKDEGGVTSVAQVLQGICSLQSLSCSVETFTRLDPIRVPLLLVHYMRLTACCVAVAC